MIARPVKFVCACAALLVLISAARAQDNYEIQVYASETVPAGVTMVEFHTNFTASGRKEITHGLLPTNHALHETIEVTRGFNRWFETGFYIFTSARSGVGWDWVGDHVRPRVRVPESWHWPVGVSISNEIGYQRPLYSVDTWTWEIRPIVDRKLGPWYLSFNPSLERALVGPNASKGFDFSPNFKFGCDLVPQVSAGMEYYGALGPIANFDPLAEQEQQIFPTIDLNVSPQWEINFGIGVGMTRSTDHLIVKFILGRRFDKIPFLQRR